MAVELATAYISIIPDTSKIAPGVKRALTDAESGADATGRNIGTKLSSGLGSTLKFGALIGASATAGAKITEVIGSAFVKGFQRLSDIDLATKKFQALGLSAQQVGGVMDNILGAVKGTPYAFNEAAAAASSFVAAGLSGQQVGTIMRSIADTASFTGSNFTEIGTIFTQVFAKGRLQGEEMMQLMERGVPITSALAKHFHVAESAVADMVSKGKVSFADFQATMAETLGGQAAKAGETFQGALMNTEAALARLGATLLGPVFKAAPNILAGITDAIDWLGKAAEPAAAAFATGMGRVFEAVKAVWDLVVGGDFTGTFARIFHVEEDAPIIGQLLGLRDTALSVFSAIKDGVTGFVAAFTTGGEQITRTGFAGFMQQLGVYARDVADLLGPALRTLGSILLDVGSVAMPIVVDAFKGLFTAIGGVVGVITSIVNAFKAHKDIAVVLGSILAAVLLPTLVTMAATWVANTVAMAAYNTVMFAYQVATKIAAAAQWALNAAMSANPIGLIIAALVALVGGIVLAYRHSETFRNIVQSVWKAIQTAVKVAWETVIKPTWEAIKVGLQALATVFSWLWDNIVKPYWTALAQGIMWAWTNIIQPAWEGMKIGLQVLGTVFGFIWDNVIKPYWTALATGILWAWENIIAPAWDALKAALQGVGDLFGFIWNNVIKPAWDALATGIEWAWENVIRPAWDAMRAALQGVGDFFGFVWNNVIKPVWDALGAGISWVVTNVVLPVWDTLKNGLESVETGFADAVDFIGKVWDGIKAVVAKPIRFVVETVYNNGIRAAWNKVAGWLHLPELPAADLGQLAGYARGGYVTGPGGPRDDRIPAMLSNGEYVLTAEAVRQIGIANLDKLNRNPIRGGGRVLGEGMFVGVDGLIRQGMEAGGSAAVAIENVKEFMRRENGKPYQYGGVGDPSWDCSALWSGIVHVLRGEDPRSGRLFSTESNFEAMGWKPGLGGAIAIGIMRGGGGPNSHMAGTVAGTNAESSGDHGVAWGGPARGADDPMFGLQYWLPDIGGLFFSGGVAAGTAGGSIGRFLRQRVADAVDAILRPIGDHIPDFAAGAVGQVPRAMFDTMREAVRSFLLGEADKQDVGPSGEVAPGSGPVMDQVREAFAAYGWDTGAEWDAAAWIIAHESGWNPTARNPDSGAYGLGQFLGSTKDQYLPDENPNPRVQGAAIARYIKDRYGDPLAAKDHWLAHHWYDAGGVWPSGTVGVNQSGKPEAVLTNDQWALFRRFVTALEHTDIVGAIEALAGTPAPTEPSPPATTTTTGGDEYTPMQSVEQFGQKMADIIPNAAVEILGVSGTPLDPSHRYWKAATDIAKTAMDYRAKHPVPAPALPPDLGALAAGGLNIGAVSGYDPQQIAREIMNLFRRQQMRFAGRTFAPS